MKILSIRCKNINSLRGETVVDFTLPPLKDSGLFAIIGATGSGKTTLLDCITLALFNEVPRLKHISADAIRKGGLIITRNETDCYAEVTYSCREGIFTSRWAIRKKRGSENFDNPKMTIVNVSGIPMADKNKEVIKLNEDNIGLSYEQFVKSIILCQGEFAKFLKSDKNDRAKLLEEITRTSDFRRIGKKAYEMHKRQTDILGHKISYFQRIEEKILNENDRTTLQADLKDVESKILAAVEEMGMLEKKLGVRRQLEHLKTEVEKRRSAKESLDGKMAEFKSHFEESILAYRRLLPFKDELKEYDRQLQDIAEASKENAALDKKLFDANKEIEEQLRILSEWLKEEVSENDFVDHLEAFRGKVMDLEAQKNQTESAQKQILAQLKTVFSSSFLKQEQQLFSEQGQNEMLVLKLQTRMEAATVKFATYVKAESIDEHNIEEKRKSQQELIGELAKIQLAVKERMEQFELLAKLTASNEKQSKGYVELQKDLAQAQKDLNAKEQGFKMAEEARRKMLSEQSFEEYRKRLVEGDPCPLCGSADHPYVHHYAQDLGVAESRYVEAERALVKAREDEQELKLSNNNVEKELGYLKEKIDASGLRSKDLDQSIRVFATRIGLQDFEHESSVELLLTSCKTDLGKLVDYQSFLSARPLFEQALEGMKTYDQKCKDLLMQEKAVIKLYGGKDIQHDCRQKRAGLDQAIRIRQETEQSLSGCKLRLDKYENLSKEILSRISAPIGDLGYQTVESASAAMLEETVYLKLIEQQHSIDNELTAAAELLLADEEKFLNEQGNDDSDFDDRTGAGRIVELTHSVELFRKNEEDIKLGIRTDLENRKELEEGGKEMADMKLQMRPWELLNALIGDATGNKFNEFAQKLTLQHLLRFCNLRLKKLHSRYELSMPEADEDDDLVVTDRFMGDERRSVKTLSGGETFIISLALALGLSDLASRDIRIDSLFVDEGFGTLDSETLEEAITTLEQLQAEYNKTVGIISHVESLKERIYTQVRLEKQQSGYSILSIHPKANP